MSSHPLYWHHHTHFLYDITLGMWMANFALYVTSSLYDIKPPFLWHHTHYIWDRIHCISVITYTVLMICQQVYLGDLLHYIWHHIHCIRHHSQCMCVITSTLSLIWHPLYVGHHTHYMYNIICTLQGITSTFYDITPHYLWHHKHCIHDIRSPIYDITSTVYDISSPIPVTS